jgi:hypothetical protein
VGVINLWGPLCRRVKTNPFESHFLRLKKDFYSILNRYYLLVLSDTMADNLEKGVLCIVAATFFLLLGLKMLDFQIFEPEFSTLLAFICLGVGIYFLTKK